MFWVWSRQVVRFWVLIFLRTKLKYCSQTKYFCFHFRKDLQRASFIIFFPTLVWAHQSFWAVQVFFRSISALFLRVLWKFMLACVIALF